MPSTELLGALTSALALLASLWVWTLQRRREGPRLEPWWGGEAPRWRGHYATEDEKVVRVHFEAPLLIANLSALPDALLDVRAKVKAKEAGWLPLIVLRTTDPHRDDEYPPLPMDLPPRQVVERLTGFAVHVPGGVAEDVPGYLQAPLQIEVELVGLGERCHRGVVVAGAKGG